MKVTGPGGNTYTKVAGGAAIRGPGGNTVAAGRGASFVNGQFVGGTVLDRRQRQLHPLELLHAGLVRPLSRRLVAGQVGRGDHRLGHGSSGPRPAATAVAPATAPTTTTAKT